MLRHWLVCLAILLAPLSTQGGGQLPQAKNFQMDGKALEQKQILLVLVSQNGCSYCEQGMELFLSPMHAGGLYHAKALFRELNMDASGDILDFQGQPLTTRQFARRYQAYVTPTILFLDQHGQSLADPIIGINTLEFYGYYLDQAIDQAISLKK